MIIPAIDLMNGNVVQLQQGKTLKIKIGENPLVFAQKFSTFPEVQVVDLDAAMRNPENNFQLVKKICGIVNARVGGGIDSVEKAQELVKAGAKKIIIGTKADEAFLKELMKKIGKEKIAVALDSKKGKVVIKGWKESTALSPVEKAKQLEDFCGEFFYTCVDKEGMMQGTDFDTIRELRKTTKNRLTVAGGISTMEEVEKLDKMRIDCVVGMALYTGKIKIKGLEF